MHTTIGVPLSLALLVSLAAVAARATVEARSPDGPFSQVGPFPLYRTTLPNGLGLWVQPRADTPSVAAILVVQVGAR